MRSLIKFFALSISVLSSLALVSCNKSEQSSNSLENSTSQTSANYSATTQDTTSLVIAHGIPQGVKLAPQQELHLLQSIPIPNTDISYIDTVEVSEIYKNVFEPLVRKARDGSYIPASAQSYEVSQDGLTWTFHLQPDAKWQDDKPVIAHDFVYSWQRLINSNDSSTQNYLAQMGVVNAAEIIAGKLPATELGVTAIDEYTLQVKLNHPLPWLPTMVSSINLVPLREDLIAQHPKDWFIAGKVIGNGAFKFVSNNSTNIVLEKASTYWDRDNVAPTKVNINVIQQDEARLSRFSQGLVDIYATPVDLTDSKDSLDFKVEKESLKTEQYLSFNLKRIPDVQIRKALALLIPDQSQGFPAYYKFAPEELKDAQQIKEYTWSTTPYSERVKQALEILAQHGYSETNPLVLTYIVQQNTIGFTYVMDKIEQTTNKIVVLEPRLVHFDKDYNVEKYNGDLIFNGWHADFDHVSNFANLFTCVQHDITEYCNKDYDALVAQAAAERDEPKRQALYGQASEILNSELPVIYLRSVQNSFLINPQLDGYTKANIRYINYQDLYLLAK